MALFNIQNLRSCASLPQVNQKMILILTASIMYWSLQQQATEAENTPGESHAASVSSESETVLSNEVSNLSVDDTASPDAAPFPQIGNEQSSKKAENEEPPSQNVENEEHSTNAEGKDGEDKDRLKSTSL